MQGQELGGAQDEQGGGNVAGLVAATAALDFTGKGCGSARAGSNYFFHERRKSMMAGVDIGEAAWVEFFS
jgi:hypothetical protein